LTVAAGILSVIANYAGIIAETAKINEVRVRKVEENNFSFREAH